MVNRQVFEEFTARMNEMLAQSPAKDVEKNLRALMTTFFARLDLVTREEFDIQQAVLERTREKLALLERRLAELEQAARQDG